MTPQTRADLLRQIWWAGVHSVGGATAVSSTLTEAPIPPPDLILAVGKAAEAMAKAAHARYAKVPTLAITKAGHTEPGLAFQVLESAHPVPDISSLNAGSRLLAEVVAAPPGSHLLLLVSGGASSLVEVLRPGLSLDDLARLNRTLIASGKDIATINAERSRVSMIKGGGLLAQFRGARITVLAISDTRGDRIETIGAGIGFALPRHGLVIETRIVASNAVARSAAAACARSLGFEVHRNDETLYDDVDIAADTMASALSTPKTGVLIWGGEPTVILPPHPGVGGRNQALGLLTARAIAGRSDVSIIVAGTDGSDGPTAAAGALVDGTTWTDAANQFLAEADSGTYLARKGAIMATGPTGTNVMDLAIALTD